MPILIDVNTIPAVFDAKHQSHKDFKSVLDWLNEGDGKIIYGGKKYKQELTRMSKYNGLFSEYKRAGKALNYDDTKIDARENDIKQKLTLKKISTANTRYNDSHIVAILAETKCKLLCSSDAQSYNSIKDVSLYDKSTDRPKIYTGARNDDLLVKCH